MNNKFDKVYIAIDDSWDDCPILGVFLTKEAAKKKYPYCCVQEHKIHKIRKKDN